MAAAAAREWVMFALLLRTVVHLHRFRPRVRPTVSPAAVPPATRYHLIRLAELIR